MSAPPLAVLAARIPDFVDNCPGWIAHPRPRPTSLLLKIATPPVTVFARRGCVSRSGAGNPAGNLRPDHPQSDLQNPGPAAQPQPLTACQPVGRGDSTMSTRYDLGKKGLDVFGCDLAGSFVELSAQPAHDGRTIGKAAAPERFHHSGIAPSSFLSLANPIRRPRRQGVDLGQALLHTALQRHIEISSRIQNVDQRTQLVRGAAARGSLRQSGAF